MKILNQYRGLRREIYVLAFGKTVTCLGATVWPMMTLILSRKLGMDASSIASLLIVFQVVSIPCMMITGYLSDHFSKKKIIIIYDMITAIGYFIMSVFDVNMYTIVLFFIAGLFAMMEHPAYDALIADLSSEKDREKAYSLSYLGANLGMVLSPMIAGFLFENHLKLSFCIDSFTTLVSTMMIVLFVKNIQCVENDHYSERKVDESLLKVLWNHKIIIYFLVCSLLIEFIYSQFNFLLPLNLSQVFESQGVVYFGLLTSLNAIVVVIGTPMFTRWFHKVTDITKILISVILFMIGYMGFILFQNIIGCYFVSVFIFTCGEIMNSLRKYPYMTIRVPSSHRARVLSLQRIIDALFIALAQKGIGIFMNKYTMTTMWCIVTVIALITVLCVYILREFDKNIYSLKK